MAHLLDQVEIRMMLCNSSHSIFVADPIFPLRRSPDGLFILQGNRIGTGTGNWTSTRGYNGS